MLQWRRAGKKSLQRGRASSSAEIGSEPSMDSNKEHTSTGPRPDASWRLVAERDVHGGDVEHMNAPPPQLLKNSLHQYVVSIEHRFLSWAFGRCDDRAVRQRFGRPRRATRSGFRDLGEGDRTSAMRRRTAAPGGRKRRALVRASAGRADLGLPRSAYPERLIAAASSAFGELSRRTLRNAQPGTEVRPFRRPVL